MPVDAGADRNRGEIARNAVRISLRFFQILTENFFETNHFSFLIQLLVFALLLPLYVTKYCSGRFYFLSKSALSNLINKRENIIKEYLEDYAIGFNLDSQFKINMLNLTTNNFFTDIELSDFPKLVKEGKI